MGKKNTKRRPADRGNYFFDSPDGVWQKCRLIDDKEEGKRASEHNLIKLKDLKTMFPDNPDAEDKYLWDLYFKKRASVLKLKEVKRKVKLNKPETEADKHTLRDAIKKATETPGKYMQTLRPKSLESYKQQLSVWDSEIGHLKLSQITPAVVDETWDVIKTPCRSNSTMNRYTAALSSLLGTYCMEFNPTWLKYNPCNWKEFKRQKEPPARTKPMSMKNREKLLSFCSDELKFATKLAIQTSARQSEIWKLQWGEVDFTSQWITFNDTKNGEPRTVPIYNQQIWDTFLDMYKNKQDGINYVFPSSNGNKRKGTFRYIDRPKSFRKAFETARKKAGLEDYHWHDFRHTGITDMMHAGIKDDYIKDMSGHKTDAMLNKYKHTNPVHLLEEAKKLSEYVSANSVRIN